MILLLARWGLFPVIYIYIYIYIYSLFCLSGLGWGLSGSPLEGPAEPLSACCPPPVCCRIHRKLPCSSKVYPCSVSSFCWRKHKGSWDSKWAVSSSVTMFHPVTTLSPPSPAALCGPAWTCCSPWSIATLTARTAAADRPAATSACTGPSMLPARLSSTR